MRRMMMLGLAVGALVVSAMPLSAETKTGKPAAVVTEDGKVYTITGKYAENKNAKLVDFASKMVEVTGDVKADGAQMTIDASSVKAAK
jgi:hypothetical protein